MAELSMVILPPALDCATDQLDTGVKVPDSKLGNSNRRLSCFARLITGHCGLTRVSREPATMTQPTSRRDLLKLGAGAVAGGLAAATPAAVRADDDDVAAVPDLKITRVTTFHLECELERAFGASVSVPLDKTRTALLVNIETNAGHGGWGETSPISGAQATSTSR